jgi:hemoglobin/transferrin/lactoferrin receptor protein
MTPFGHQAPARQVPGDTAHALALSPAAAFFAAPPWRAGLIALAVQALLWPAATMAQAPADATLLAQARERESLPEVKVSAEALRREAGAKVVVTQEEVEKTGATGIADVIRYQPLVEAPGTVSGATRGASRYDRSGTTGYNIRGIEGNRVGLDVDGIEMPDAVSRAPLTNRAQDGTFGMGRDFIDPDIYSAVEIQSGTTNAQRTAGGIGGAVSFRSKSPEDYVSASKPLYLGAKLGYSGANSAWTKGMTAAGLSGDFGALVSYVRRDGKETQNNSLGVPSYPDDWHSDALLLKGSLRLNPEHKLELGADLYRRESDTRFEAWNTAATAVTGNSHQIAKTERSTLHAAHTWAPLGGGLVDQLNTRIYWQDTEMNDVTDTVTLATRASERDISKNTTRQLGFSSVADKRVGKHALKFGVNYSTADNAHPFSSTDPLAGRQPFPDTNTVRMGLFAEDTIEWEVGGRRLALVPGLRVDRVRPRIENAASFANERITAAELERMYGSTAATTIVSPSLAVLYDVAPALTAYAQWKRSGRAPTNSEVFGYWNGGGGTYALVGNKDLGKETSNAFDIGLKGSPTDGVVFNGSVFHTRYKDFISYTRYTRANNPELFTHIQQSLSILYQASNRDEAHISGAEFSARLEHGTWTPAAKCLYSTWAFGYSQGSSQSNFKGDRKVDLDSVQPGKAIIGLGFDAPQKAWGLNLTGTFVKGKQAVSTNRLAFSNDPGATLTDSTTELFRVPGFARFDLAGYYRVSQNVRLTAGIFNITDKKYWAYSSTRNLQPQSAQDRRQIQLSTAPGRTYALSLNVDF